MSSKNKNKKLNMRDEFFKAYHAKEETLVVPKIDAKTEDEISSTREIVEINDDSFNIDDILAKYATNKTVKTKRGTKKNVKRKSNFGESDCIDLDYILEVPQKTTKRCRKSTRLAQVDNDSIVIITDDAPHITDIVKTKPKQTKKPKQNGAKVNGLQMNGKKRGDICRANVAQPNTSSGTNSSATGGSDRGRTTRSSRAPIQQYSTINIGNCDEYPDDSSNVPLFTAKTNKVVDLAEDLDENEELSVKVHWRNREVHRFSIRRYQKLKKIFEHFSDKENVGQHQLLFMYNDAIITADDTPDSIAYNIAKFIDGGVIDRPINLNRVKMSKNKGIKIKFQFKNCKKPYEISVDPDDKLSLAFVKCAEHLETPIHKLKFEFDGDYITGTQTPRELEFEGGECIDVKID